MSREPSVAWVAVVAGLLAAIGCDRTGAPPAEPKAAPAAAAASPSVTVVRPERKSLRRVIEQPGTVHAYEETQLFAKLPGYVSKVNADIGQAVRGPKFDASGRETEPGEVLAEIAIPETEEESRQKQALVRQAEAEVEQSRKALAAAKAAVASAEAAVTEARAGLSRAQAQYERWESESKRVSGLVRDRVIDAQTRDETNNQFRAAGAAREEAQARVTSAEAAVRKSEADRDKAEADVQAAEAKRDVARADARRLEALLQYTKIRAPYDGVVTRRHVNTRDFLRPGSKDGVFTVARLDPVRIVVEVPEADAALVRDKAPVRITVQALRGAELTGTVTRTSWALEPVSRTLRVETDLPNRDGRLRPGMYVYARITAALPEAWVLPAAAVAKQGDTVVCFLVEGGKAVRTPVQLGHADGPLVEVRGRAKPGPAGGWEPFTGAEQVALPAANLTDGQAVP